MDRPYGSLDALLQVEIGKSLAEVRQRIADTARARSLAAAEATTGDVEGRGRPRSETEINAQFTHFQPERAEQSGVSRRQQQKLDALARLPDQTHIRAVREGRASVHGAYVAAGHVNLPDFPSFVVSDKGLASSPDEVKTLVSLRHRHEDGDGATRERMAWLRQEVTDLLNPPESEWGTNQHTGGLRNTKSSESDNADYVVRRLKRDGEKDGVKDELVKRVIAGEVSAHAAAVAAVGGRGRLATNLGTIPDVRSS